MKTKILLLSFAFICSVGTLSASLLTDKGQGGGNRPISGNKSLKIPPITISIKQGICIETTLLSTIGIVEVSIKNRKGIGLYNSSVDSFYNPNFHIDISRLSSDSYTISFTGENGVKILVNDFSIE